MDFSGKVVVDVGAGSGILSLFAAQVKRVLIIYNIIILDSWMHIIYKLERVDFLGNWNDTNVIYVLLLRLFGQAGAKHVYAVEASEMADYARKLIAGNPLLADRITVTFFGPLFSNFI